MVAQGRDVHSRFLGRFQYRRSLAGFNLFIVNSQRNLTHLTQPILSSSQEDKANLAGIDFGSFSGGKEAPKISSLR